MGCLSVPLVLCDHLPNCNTAFLQVSLVFPFRRFGINAAAAANEANERASASDFIGLSFCLSFFAHSLSSDRVNCQSAIANSVHCCAVLE